MQRLDAMVLITQEYLNNTYTGNPHWIRLDENGKTGWPTIRGLIRALQIEVGIPTPNGTFGPATEEKCPTLKKDFNPTERIKRLVYILQGAMWCKGFSPGGLTGTFGDGTEAGVKRFQTSAGLSGTEVNGIASPMIFKALLNMDAYVLVSSGDPKIREIQMNLNRDYYKWIGLKPTDGRYGRDTNKALIYAIQVEEGIDVPNGTFGPQTQAKLPTISYGSSQANFVRIAQYALYCNRYDPTGFTGTFGNGTLTAVREFQKFCMLPNTGNVGPMTWASLLVSCGDKNRKGIACDCSSEVTDARAKTLKLNGYEIVGRYIAGGEWKKLKIHEAEVIFKNGLKLFPIYQTAGNSAGYFTSEKGTLDAREAINSALKYGFPRGTIIYFAVDFDAVNDEVTSNILPYFRKIKEVFKEGNPKKYKIGIYGARNVCTRVGGKRPGLSSLGEGISESSFVGDMSTGFSGNLGYPLPPDWAFDQIKEYTIGIGDGAIAIDNDISSNKDQGVDHLDKDGVIPPGFTEKYVLEFGSNTSLFTGAGIQFETFNKKVLIATPSFIPLITVEGELSLVETLIGPHNTINFLEGSSSFTTSIIDSSKGTGVDLEIGKNAQNALDLTMAKLRVTQSIGLVKYYIEFDTDGSLSIVLETTAPCKSPIGSEVLYIYQRVYITIHPSRLHGFNKIQVPIATTDIADVSPEISNQGWIFNVALGVTAFGVLAGAAYLMGTGYVVSAGIAKGLQILSGLLIPMSVSPTSEDTEIDKKIKE